MYEGNTRVIDLTLDELTEYLIKRLDERHPIADTREVITDSDDMIDGIQGLADYLGICYNTAQAYKKGKLRSAVKQVGRTVKFSKKKVNQLMQL